jgi:hypothetical protein
MKKIDRNNLIVDHSRDLRENKEKIYWQKIAELLFWRSGGELSSIK